jgi:hypothetical protein
MSLRSQALMFPSAHKPCVHILIPFQRPNTLVYSKNRVETNKGKKKYKLVTYMHCTTRTATRTLQCKRKIPVRGTKAPGAGRQTAGSLTRLSTYPHHRTPTKSPSLPPRATPSRRTVHPRATPPRPRPGGAPGAAHAPQIRARRP